MENHEKTHLFHTAPVPEADFESVSVSGVCISSGRGGGPLMPSMWPKSQFKSSRVRTWWPDEVAFLILSLSMSAIAALRTTTRLLYFSSQFHEISRDITRCLGGCYWSIVSPIPSQLLSQIAIPCSVFHVFGHANHHFVFAPGAIPHDDDILCHLMP